MSSCVIIENDLSANSSGLTVSLNCRNEIYLNFMGRFSCYVEQRQMFSFTFSIINQVLLIFYLKNILSSLIIFLSEERIKNK